MHSPQRTAHAPLRNLSARAQLMPEVGEMYAFGEIFIRSKGARIQVEMPVEWFADWPLDQKAGLREALRKADEHLENATSQEAVFAKMDKSGVPRWWIAFLRWLLTR